MSGGGEQRWASGGGSGPRLPRRVSVAAGEEVEQQLAGSRGWDGLRVNIAVVEVGSGGEAHSAANRTRENETCVMGGELRNYSNWGEKILHLKHYPRIELFSYFSLVCGAISGAIDILTLILGGG